MQHDADHGIKRIGGKFLCARDEIAGGVVDERVDFPELLIGAGRCRFNGGVVANVAGGVSRSTP